MDKQSRKAHWEKIYSTKLFTEVSWYQAEPQVSMDYIAALELPPHAAILDVGGGDSFLVDPLLAAGYTNITVLDISEKAIKRAQKRLGAAAKQVTWVVSDLLDYSPDHSFDFWHDRAVFHFLTQPEEQQAYVALAAQHLQSEGKLVIGTFSDQGPTRCSGIDIQQYSEASLLERFQPPFRQLFAERLPHQTPFDTVQEFLFMGFELP